MLTAVRCKSPVIHTSKNKPSLSERHRNFQKSCARKSNPGIKARLINSICWAWREFQYWLCYYKDEDEIDVEELLTNPFNTQPPSLNELSQVTGFQKQWIMFLYRNFKQKCLNGRMSMVQWRQIFRQIFKNAADIEYADRIFLAIAGNRSQKLITFEDLIMYLCELNQWQQLKVINDSNNPSAMAQFAFSLMKPNEKGQVDIKNFTDYVECVFSLNSRPVGCSENTFDHFQVNTSNSTFSKTSSRSPALQNFASEQFSVLDKEEKGYITVYDLERLFAELANDKTTVDFESHSNGKTVIYWELSCRLTKNTRG
ncbi:unnamed protein product [Enterobius vermicularis]|uniref:EF-hand domain-containing protein n=1 Tax=Enterobius vermicularis TaxID=51028 RepID=A0A0N4VMC8_ENTVE|nr:unnamed protein product [Enterobius vermicularis]